MISAMRSRTLFLRQPGGTIWISRSWSAMGIAEKSRGTRERRKLRDGDSSIVRNRRGKNDTGRNKSRYRARESVAPDARESICSFFFPPPAEESDWSFFFFPRNAWRNATPSSSVNWKLRDIGVYAINDWAAPQSRDHDKFRCVTSALFALAPRETRKACM